jgi:predicted regulator of Ras-like GTPase activity (Roadblock/LC7/MglB family)
MKDIGVIAAFPEVVGAVLSDPAGALLDSFGSVDGEAAGAVHAYSVVALSQAGELLGLGAFQRAAVVGRGATCLLSIEGDAVLGVYVDPSKPLPTIEKKLRDALQG